MSAGSFDSQRNMIVAKRTGNVARMLAAMSFMIPAWARRLPPPKPVVERAAKSIRMRGHYTTFHRFTGDHPLNTAVQRLSVWNPLPGKRAIRRNRHKIAFV